MTTRRELIECDVAVIGGGPAGIAAATRASEAGARVVILDEGLRLGGQIWRHGPSHRPPAEGRRWLDRLGASSTRVHTETAVVDAGRDGNGRLYIIGETSAGAAVIVHPRTLILATGARERFLPFPGWTLSGVVGIGGAQALLKSGSNLAGRHAVVAGSGPLILPVAASLVSAGARVLLMAEQASPSAVRGFAAGLWRRPSLLARAGMLRIRCASTPYRTGWWVSSAIGEQHVREVVLADGSTVRSFKCDLLCASFGLVPNVELAQQLRCELRDGAVRVDAQQLTSQSDIYAAGEPTGIGGVDLAIVEGEIAGWSAAGYPERTTARARKRAALQAVAGRMARSFALRPDLRALASADTIVCRCEDVRLGSIKPEWTPRQAKLYTRIGMGACQGRICGSAMAHLRGWDPPTVRFPIQPTLVSTVIAGNDSSSE